MNVLELMELTLTRSGAILKMMLSGTPRMMYLAEDDAERYPAYGNEVAYLVGGKTYLQ